jgi:hypothetical protein
VWSRPLRASLCHSSKCSGRDWESPVSVPQWEKVTLTVLLQVQIPGPQVCADTPGPRSRDLHLL